MTLFFNLFVFFLFSIVIIPAKISRSGDCLTGLRSKPVSLSGIYYYDKYFHYIT